MNQETCLEIQALVDGELAPSRRGAVDRLLASNQDAHALRESLAAVQTTLVANEPEFAVPETREFYWSKIQRQIAAEERATQTAERRTSPVLGVLRWLVPVAGVGALALALALPSHRSVSGTLAAVDNVSASPSSVVYRSDAQGVTVHWIN
jgi:anti-sigma factor RsiW